MKVCNAEIIKIIKDLEEKKQDNLALELRTSVVRYQTSEDRIKTDYDFTATRNKIAELNSEIRRLKHLLNISNATVIIEEFEMTIGECLVYMAQLNNEKAVLDRMSNMDPKTRYSTGAIGGGIEYAELEYDIGECKAKFNEVKETVRKLQLAIDRINLTNMIEI